MILNFKKKNYLDLNKFEKHVACKIDYEAILQWFQNTKKAIVTFYAFALFFFFGDVNTQYVQVFLCFRFRIIYISN